MKIKKMIILLGIVCTWNILLAGCGTTHEYVTDKQEKQVLSEEPKDALSEENAADTEETQENTAGKWKVLEPEIAAACDADFKGKVWKIAEDSFYIAETKVKILEDGSLSNSTPSSNAPIPDSQLIQVVFDDDTGFYVRTIYDNGESHEDKKAGFRDLQQYMRVDLKGKFENDVFYAVEVRIVDAGDVGAGKTESVEQEENTVADPITGIVEEYTDDTITIKDPGDGLSYYFLLKDAQIVEGDLPIAVGDKVEVTYQGLLGDVKNPGECSVICKIE